MPARARSKGLACVKSAAPKRMLPVRAGTSPLSVRSSVVLPTPFLPSSAVTFPVGISNDRSRRMCEPP